MRKFIKGLLHEGKSKEDDRVHSSKPQAAAPAASVDGLATSMGGMNLVGQTSHDFVGGFQCVRFSFCFYQNLTKSTVQAQSAHGVKLVHSSGIPNSLELWKLCLPSSTSP